MAPGPPASGGGGGAPQDGLSEILPQREVPLGNRSDGAGREGDEKALAVLVGGKKGKKLKPYPPAAPKRKGAGEGLEPPKPEPAPASKTKGAGSSPSSAPFLFPPEPAPASKTKGAGGGVPSAGPDCAGYVSAGTAVFFLLAGSSSEASLSSGRLLIGGLLFVESKETKPLHKTC